METRIERSILSLIIVLFVLVFSVVSVFAVPVSDGLQQTGSYEGNLDVGSASDGTVIISGPGQDTVNLCGNWIINTGEQCDKLNLNGQTCASRLGSGYSGTLSCNSECNFDASGCYYSQSNGTNGGSTDGGSTSSSGGGGGGGTSNAGRFTGTESCVENWQCTVWGVCSTESSQERTCADLNSCGTSSLKPSESRSCDIVGAYGDAALTEAGESARNGGSLLSRITGAVIGGGVTSGVALAFVLIILVLAGWFFVSRRNRK